MPSLFEQIVAHLDHQRKLAAEEASAEASARKVAKILAGVQAGPKKKLWKKSKRAFGDHVLKGKSKEQEMAALKRACAEWDWWNPRTGKPEPMTAKSIKDTLYNRDQIERRGRPDLRS